MVHCDERPGRRNESELEAFVRRAGLDGGAGTAAAIRRLTTIHDAVLAVTAEVEPWAIADTVVRELSALIPYRRALVAVVEPSSRRIEVLAHADGDVATPAGECERISRLIQDSQDAGVVRWVVENAQPLRVDDTALESRYLVVGGGMRSELCVPIVRGGRVFGAINVEHEKPHGFGEDDALILATVASQVGVALENAELYADLRVELAQRNEAESALAQSEQRYRALVEHAGEGIIVVCRGVIEFTNPRAVELLAGEGAGLGGRHLLELIDASDHPDIERFVGDVLDDTHITRARAIAVLDIPGRWVDVTMSRIRWDGLPAVLAFVGDVTVTLELNRRLAYQASHDDLTGLVNRREFESRLGAALAKVGESGVRYAMCYIDLDQFKIINDTCGHAAGDELLRRLSGLLAARIRSRDTLARLGGDEFGVLLENCDLEEAERVATEIESTVRDFRFAWGGVEYIVGASVGVVGVDSTHESVSEVLKAADSACYMAKEEGRGRIRVYREGDAALNRRAEEMRWVAAVRAAMEARRLELFCQPIVALGDRRGGERHELLVRLRQPDGELILPGVFLPAVERYDLAPSLDRYVVDNALAWLGADRARLDRIELCSINLSARSLGNAALLAAIEAAFESNRVPGSKICFEVTETAAIRDRHASVAFMRALGTLGCRFALDDFGAGLSSFAYLRDLPVQILKIDGSFVRDLVGNPTNVAMVTAMQQLAAALGKSTVAEFASSTAIVAALGDIGVDFAQGYAIGRPVPIATIDPGG